MTKKKAVYLSILILFIFIGVGLVYIKLYPCIIDGSSEKGPISPLSFSLFYPESLQSTAKLFPDNQINYSCGADVGGHKYVLFLKTENSDVENILQKTKEHLMQVGFSDISTNVKKTSPEMIFLEKNEPYNKEKINHISIILNTYKINEVENEITVYYNQWPSAIEELRR